MIDLGVKLKFVEKSGTWYSFDSVRLGQGKENAKKFLRTNPEIKDKLIGLIKNNMKKIADDDILVKSSDSNKNTLDEEEDSNDMQNAV
jgi:recombination protein RecA